MKDLFFAGGALFMGILSLLFIILIAWFTYHLLLVLGSKNISNELLKTRAASLKAIGLFAMVSGILGQLLGLYNAFSDIEKAGDINPGIVYSGLKVSMITTLYGMCIYLLAILLWFGLSFLVDKRMQ